MVLCYNDKGHCPMLAGDKCSIHEDRPPDLPRLRIAAFSRRPVFPSRRVNAWVFSCNKQKSREEQRLVKDASVFLQNDKELFFPGVCPLQPAQFAALAIRVHRLFCRQPRPDGEVVRAILAERDDVR